MGAKRILCCCTTVAALFLFISPAMAVDDYGIFELEGNAVQDASPPPDDWETLEGGGGSANVTTDPDGNVIIEEGPGVSIFDGGKKDIQDPTRWSGKDGSVPDKNDITNAYAAAYLCPASNPKCTEDDLVIYFGADRFSNGGDAFMGFWFFQDDVSYNSATGEFECTDADGDGLCHKVNDTLVLANFPQATNAVPEIKVVQWDPTCPKAENNDPQETECAAKNLRLLLVDTVVCDGTSADACAVTNVGTEEAPWPYEAKFPDPAQPFDFPFESFFEGGINLTEIFSGLDICVASFMAETRSSSSFTAALKDFVIGEFPVCAVELSKSCGTGNYDPGSGSLKFGYEVTVENTGVATVAQVVAHDDNCGEGSGTNLTFGPLLPGQSESQTAFCLIPTTADLSQGVTNGVSAVADGGAIPVNLADSCITDSATSPGVCFAGCNFDLTPAIAVTKTCTTALEAVGGIVKVRVNFSGSVTNTSDQEVCDTNTNKCLYQPLQSCTADEDCNASPVPIENLTAGDSEAGNITGSLTLTTLNPGQSADFSGFYYPDGTGIGFDTCPDEASFTDTVTVGGDDVFQGVPISEQAMATCALCPGSCPQ